MGFVEVFRISHRFWAFLWRYAHAIEPFGSASLRTPSEPLTIEAHSLADIDVDSDLIRDLVSVDPHGVARTHKRIHIPELGIKGGNNKQKKATSL